MARTWHALGTIIRLAMTSDLGQDGPMGIIDLHEDGEQSYFTHDRSGYRFRVDYSDGVAPNWRNGWWVYRYDVEPEILWGRIEAHQITLYAYAGDTADAEPHHVSSVREGIEWIVDGDVDDDV